MLHAARAYARLGADVAVTAACTTEDRDTLLPELEALGLETTWWPSATTTAFTFHYDGDRRVMRQDAVGESWPPGQALAAAGDAAWVHVGALSRSDFPEETLAALARSGRSLLVDAQGLVRTPALGPLQRDAAIGECLRHVTVLKLSRAEAQILAGTTDDADGLRALGVPEIVVTLGSQGSLVVAGDVTERVAAPPVAGRVDPTGAGDTFSAAYLDARTRGLAPAQALREASAFVAVLLAERARAA